uniref:Uncharacterized protein n=1 Tax=viral metagenome TaxID=1070528 RepID=A0A6H1ZNH6_9ZZZZ
MNIIRFSHYYRKFNSFNLAHPFKLLYVFRVDSKDMSNCFKYYDTLIADEGGFYYLPSGRLLVLLFEQDFKLITTIRAWTEEKERYYYSNIGNEFNFVVKERSSM